MNRLKRFNKDQIQVINDAVAMAEDLICNHYKMSANQWLRHRYDVKTLCDLGENEVVNGPFAQIVRYEGQKNNASLGSSAYDFYKICLQDHSIIAAIDQSQTLKLFPFSLYIMIHELIHIVRFSKFQQNFDASSDEKMSEEARVHKKTHEIANGLNIPGIATVLEFYQKWRNPID